MMKTKMISVLLTFCFLFTLAFPTLIAHADDEVVYESVYFITDSQEFDDEKSDAIAEAIARAGTPSSVIPIDLSSYENPFERLANEASAISDSIVIVELLSRMSLTAEQNETLPTEYLLNAFSTLKNNNCKIMFISGNDEDTYQDAIELLDYVDVHVNVDFVYLLVKGVVTKIELNEDTAGFYFIIDKNFCIPSNENTDFTKRWLFPYFKEVYGEEYANYNPIVGVPPVNSLFDFLAYTKNINFYGQAFGNSSQLYNYQNEASFDFGTNTSNIFVDNANRAYLIGLTNSSSSSEQWYSMVNWINNALYGKVFTIGFRGTGSCSYGFESSVTYTQIGTSRLMFYHVLTPSAEIFTLADIVADFIAGNNMSKYNNLIGRCAITYMPITASPDGWIPTHMVRNCYQVGSVSDD